MCFYWGCVSECSPSARLHSVGTTCLESPPGHGGEEGDGVAVFQFCLMGGKLMVDGHLQLRECVGEFVFLFKFAVERLGRSILEFGAFLAFAGQVGELCEIKDGDVHWAGGENCKSAP